MLGTLFDKVTGLFDKRFTLALLLPAFAFAAGTAALAATMAGWHQALTWWSGLDAARQVALGVAAAAAVVVLATITGTQVVAMTRLLEGYWRWRRADQTLGRLGRWREERRRERLTEAGEAAVRTEATQAALAAEAIQAIQAGQAGQATGADDDGQAGQAGPATGADDDGQAGPATGADDDARAIQVARARKANQAAQAAKASADLSYQRSYLSFAPAPAPVMPTRLGNALRAAEAYPGDEERWGLDAVFWWPRLYLILPDGARSQVDDARAALDQLVVLTMLSAAFGVVALALSCAGLSLAVGLGCAAGALLLSRGSYLAAVTSATVFGDLVRSCYDLYRGDLLSRLGWELPPTLEGERRLWGALGQQLYRRSTSRQDEALLNAPRKPPSPPPASGPGSGSASDKAGELAGPGSRQAAAADGSEPEPSLGMATPERSSRAHSTATPA